LGFDECAFIPVILMLIGVVKAAAVKQKIFFDI
jgi:hypothetical protein